MLRWIAKALATSIGKKILLGLTGCLLLLFLLEHLVGNLFLYIDAEGSAFNAYVAHLQGFGPLLKVGEVMMVLLFAVHIILAIQLTLENRAARKQKYVVRSSRGGQTLGSRSMILTGLLLLCFLGMHMFDFRFNAEFMAEGGHAASVMQAMSTPLTAVLYLAALGLVGFHVSHGFQSALQSLGINHPRWTPLIRQGSIAVAVFFALAFASFPIYYLFFWTEGGAN
jgi:succinate dehydrogenase / fumarate reductase, cytochrome b subunit